jgi:hypothetical protein
MMLDAMIVIANLSTYLAFEWYHFYNADLRSDFSGIDRLHPGIWLYDLAKAHSID